MVKFSETEEQLDILQIEEIEIYLRVKFPQQYKSHLLEFNGGRCYPNIFSFDENGRRTSSSIEWFLAIYDGKFDNLRKTIDTFKIDEKRMPKDMVPVANDGLGNLICIACGPKDYGKIYFWDHEREVDYGISDDSDYSNLYWVSDSFNEFLDGLTTGDEFT